MKINTLLLQTDNDIHDLANLQEGHVCEATHGGGAVKVQAVLQATAPHKSLSQMPLALNCIHPRSQRTAIYVHTEPFPKNYYKDRPKSEFLVLLQADLVSPTAAQCSDDQRQYDEEKRRRPQRGVARGQQERAQPLSQTLAHEGDVCKHSLSTQLVFSHGIPR